MSIDWNNHLRRAAREMLWMDFFRYARSIQNLPDSYKGEVLRKIWTQENRGE